jgi:hypothetical protein
MLYHAVVWIDHREAHVESFTRDATENSYVKALGSPRSITAAVRSKEARRP